MVLDMSFRKRTAGMNALAVFLVFMIILNFAFIWINSSKVSKDSDKTSKDIAKIVAKKTVKDYDSLPKSEKKKHIDKLNPKIRSLAHFAEFVPLGLWFFLLAITVFYSSNFLKLYILSVILATISSALCALCDEIHQIFIDGRTFQVVDILTDTLGAVLGCLIGFVFVYFKKDRITCN